MASEEDDEFWDRELRLRMSESEGDDDEGTGRPEEEGSCAGAGSGSAAPVQSTITRFFGGGRERPAQLGPSTSTDSNRNRRRSQHRQDQDVSGSGSGSRTPSSSETCNKNEDVEVIGLTAEEKEKVYSSQSLVWSYFTKLSKEEAKCKQCGIVVKTPTGTTTLMSRHLKTHLKAYSEFRKLQEIKIKISQRKANAKANNIAGKKRVILFPMDSKSKKAQQITTAIALFMVKGLKPYSIVEELGFQYLLFVLEPRYVIPSRTQFSRTIVPNMYRECKKKMQIRLQELTDNQELESVSLTIDAWSSRKLDSFLAFTVQYISPEWKMEKYTLDLDPFPGRHTADVICQNLEDKISDYNLSDEGIQKYVTSDNGANMLAALEQPSEERMNDLDVAPILRAKKAWEHLKCLNHTGQLAINDTKKEMNVNNVINKVSKLVTRYSNSKTALESFEKFQKELNLPKHDLVQRVKTRWNSDFLMLERAVEQKQAIVSECCDAGEDHLSTQEWKLAEGFVEVLRPLAEHTNEMGSESKPTASMILPTIFEITSDLKEFIRKAPKGTGIQFARKILENLEERFAYYKENETLKFATLIDPRYRDILVDFTWTSPSAAMLENKALEKYRSRVRRGMATESVSAISDTDNQASVVNNSPSSSSAPRAPSAEPAVKKTRWKHLQQKNAQRSGVTVTDDDVMDKIKDEVRLFFLLK